MFDTTYPPLVGMLGSAAYDGGGAPVLGSYDAKAIEDVRLML
mgnify:CR=1 FL=1